MANNITDIVNNPFRILDVYANASQKQILANKGKLSALASIGKSAGRTLQLSGILPDLKCSITDIDEAYKQLYMPAKKVQYAFMWFMQPEDESLRGVLEAGGGDTLTNVLSKFEGYKQSIKKDSNVPLWLLQDMAILCLLNERYTDAYIYFVELSSRAEEWLTLIGCETVNLNADGLLKMFMDVAEKNDITIDVEGRMKDAYYKLLGKLIEIDETPHCVFDLYKTSLELLPLLKMAPEEQNHYYLDVANRIAAAIIGACTDLISFVPKPEFASITEDILNEMVAYAESIMYGTTLLPKLQRYKNELEKAKKSNFEEPHVVKEPTNSSKTGSDDNHGCLWWAIMMFGLLSFFGKVLNKCDNGSSSSIDYSDTISAEFYIDSLYYNDSTEYNDTIESADAIGTFNVSSESENSEDITPSEELKNVRIPDVENILKESEEMEKKVKEMEKQSEELEKKYKNIGVPDKEELTKIIERAEKEVEKSKSKNTKEAPAENENDK